MAQAVTRDQQTGRLLSVYLASDGVYQADDVTAVPVSSYLTFSPLPDESGGLFSVALSLRLPPVDVIDHPSLRCPDFPLTRGQAIVTGTGRGGV